MFDNLIVGVDHRQGGLDALALAVDLADRDATLTLARIYQDSWRGASPPRGVAERRAMEDELKAMAADSGIEAQIRCHGAASTGRGLHELAEAEQADLLVVGSSSRGAVDRVVLGDDTRDALDGAPCAVAIAPAGYALDRRPIKRIGVGYDRSPESEHALRVARSLAGDRGGALAALQAVSIPSYALGIGPVPVADWMRSLVDEAYQRLAQLPDVEPYAVYGDPAEALATFSSSVDLVIVGSRGYGPLGRLIHGSTSRRLTRLARCPLLVLTRATEAAEPADRSSSAEPHPQLTAAARRGRSVVAGLDQLVIQRAALQPGPRAEPG